MPDPTFCQGTGVGTLAGPVEALRLPRLYVEGRFVIVATTQLNAPLWNVQGVANGTRAYLVRWACTECRGLALAHSRPRQFRRE